MVVRQTVLKNRLAVIGSLTVVMSLLLVKLLGVMILLLQTFKFVLPLEKSPSVTLWYPLVSGNGSVLLL